MQVNQFQSVIRIQGVQDNNVIKNNNKSILTFPNG